MGQVIVLGLQWGDEGKGKIVDLLCPAFDAVVRYQGGNNAGHTVKFGDSHYALHLVPSGILHESVTCVLGNGMAIAPDALLEEIAGLEGRGVETTDRLLISDRAQVILPTHRLLDQAREEARGGSKIGTTLRGIGPAYEMKAARCGVRVADLGSERLLEVLRLQHQRIAPEMSAIGAEPPPKPSSMVATCRAWAEALAPRLVDAATLINERIASRQQVLFEGAQGAMLDLDYGTYPYVTSSNTTAGGVCSGAGVPPSAIDGVIGVVKAYTTRVGSGPFPTELADDDPLLEQLRTRGNEFGTTTGRPRRVGWLDVVALRYGCMLSGVSGLALTKLDVLDELEEIRVATGYRLGNQELTALPADPDTLAEVEPVYQTFPGWQESTVGTLAIEDLPENAKAYLEAVEELSGVPIVIVSTGPRREETVVLEHPVMRKLLGRRAKSVNRQLR